MLCVTVSIMEKHRRQKSIILKCELSGSIQNSMQYILHNFLTLRISILLTRYCCIIVLLCTLFICFFIIEVETSNHIQPEFETRYKWIYFSPPQFNLQQFYCIQILKIIFRDISMPYCHLAQISQWLKTTRRGILLSLLYNLTNNVLSH